MSLDRSAQPDGVPGLDSVTRGRAAAGFQNEPRAGGEAMHDEMDCLTEQTQLSLKKKDLSRNKAKQSQKTKPFCCRNSLIPLMIDRFLAINQRNAHKTKVLITATSGKSCKLQAGTSPQPVVAGAKDLLKYQSRSVATAT
jgi:hypothetical protein